MLSSISQRIISEGNKIPTRKSCMNCDRAPATKLSQDKISLTQLGLELLDWLIQTFPMIVHVTKNGKASVVTI